MSSRRSLVTMATVAGLLVVSAPPAARAESVNQMQGRLPSALQGTSAVWDGTYAYIFGGFRSSAGASDEIVRYDPAADAVTVMEAKLPSPRYYTSAVWDGTYAYIFGGSSASVPGAISQVVRYDPVADTTAVVADLPTGLDGTSAIWDGQHAYVFGGRVVGGLTTSQVLRFDPGTASVEILPAALPQPVQGTSAVFDGSSAYVFGGLTWAGTWSDRIAGFDPQTGQVTQMAGRLPSGRGYTSAVWSGTRAHIFGGQTSDFSTDQVVSYDPGSDTTKVLGAFLPLPDYLTSAASDGTHAYVFGGVNQGAAIRRFDPRGPSVPIEVVAAAGPGQGEIRLQWKAPVNDGGSPIVAYRVYRGEDANDVSFHEEIGPAVSYVDTGLSWSATMHYRVSAVNADGEEGQLARTVSATSFPEPPSPIGLSRWWGVEGGAGCFGLQNCTLFGQVGNVPGVASGTELEDPDGVVRAWPARSGRVLARPSTPDGQGRPLPAYIETADSFPGGTVSFALRIHTLPREPVLFYRHGDVTPNRSITLTLTPTGSIVATTGGGAAVTSTTLELERWHVVGMSYGSGEPFRLFVDGEQETTMQLPVGAPTGSVSLGIVAPITSPYALGLDDYVDATKPNAPILGARISYLNPMGAGGRTEWQKQEAGDPGIQECLDLSENWQVVAEDVYFSSPSGQSCDPSFWSIDSIAPGQVDEYDTEGIPSEHVPSADYGRIPAQPVSGDSILAVRPRVAVKGPFAISAGFTQGPLTVTDDMVLGSETNHQNWWLPPDHVGHPWQANGDPWTAKALGSAGLYLENIGSIGQRQYVRWVRLDYVWVPNG